MIIQLEKYEDNNSYIGYRLLSDVSCIHLGRFVVEIKKCDGLIFLDIGWPVGYNHLQISS
jgi:hypothetical protein